MPSLTELLERHSPILILDTSSPVAQVGVLSRQTLPVWESREGEAGVALFSALKAALAQSGLTLREFRALAFCDGPGSVLGIRTAATAIRVWTAQPPRPVYAFCSLELIARRLAAQEQLHSFAVIADARRDTWHRVLVDAKGECGPLQRCATRELAGTLVTPAPFRHWSPLPPQTRTVPYSLSEHITALPSVPLFAPTDAPDAFLHEEPVYQTWSPQVHRPPS